LPTRKVVLGVVPKVARRKASVVPSPEQGERCLGNMWWWWIGVSFSSRTLLIDLASHILSSPISGRSRTWRSRGSGHRLDQGADLPSSVCEGRDDGRTRGEDRKEGPGAGCGWRLNALTAAFLL